MARRARPTGADKSGRISRSPSSVLFLAAGVLGMAGSEALGQGDVAPLAPQPATGQPVQPAGEPERFCYPVSKFVLRYADAHPQHPDLQLIYETEVELAQTTDGYVRPREGMPTVKFRLSEVEQRPVEKYCGSAIETIIKAINRRFNDLGIVAVVTGLSPEEVQAPEDPNDPDHGKDLRPAGQTELHLDLFTAVVSQVRTLAFGERIPFKQRIDSPKHARIKENSPVQPAVTKDDPERKDVLRKDLLDAYLFRLNRHPGRRVDIAVSSAEEPGTVTLDYLVAENKPWTIYGQVSNTGTKQTSEWRERVGFIDNQLTGHDDILSIDYITAGFDQANAVVGSYEAPFFGSQWLRWKGYGTWNEFTASDVGFANEQFTGDSWTAGAELIANVFQRGELFIDVVGGAKFEHIKVTNQTFGGGGEDDFFLPYGGVKLERATDVSTTTASLIFEGNVASVAGTEQTQIEGLGRLGTDTSWLVAQWDLTHSFYLEPLIYGSRWENPSSGVATLAHEVALTFKGQYAFDYRLIPNAEQVVGGLYTVRGYPESVSAGDGVLIGSAEYRFHLPNSFTVQTDPKTLFGEPFKLAPQQAYGRADWDLILRGFCDLGRTIISSSPNAEQEETLIGAGVGAELVFKRNLSVRVDWGIALEDVQSSGVSAGSSRVHIVATLLF